MGVKLHFMLDVRLKDNQLDWKAAFWPVTYLQGMQFTRRPLSMSRNPANLEQIFPEAECISEHKILGSNQRLVSDTLLETRGARISLCKS